MKNNKPLVSVVMPSYNHAEYVGKAIESVLNQTYTNFEFIIADDGSSDGSADIIRKYDDPRIKFKEYKKNTSFESCEYIWEHAEGEYIASICSDDMWKNDLLEKYVNFLENNKDYGCCFSKPIIINENDDIESYSDNSIFSEQNMQKEEWFKKLYTYGNCLCAPAVCMRKSIYDEVGKFKFQYRQLQDYEYWLRLLQVSNIYVYPEQLVMYRIHPQGENHNISKPNFETNVRDEMERKYILLDIMENLDEKFFNLAFNDELIYKPGTKQYNLECEKFGVIMLSKAAPPMVAIFYYYRHYNDEKFRFYLENYYGVSRKEFWRLTGTDHEHRLEYVNNIQQLMDTIDYLKRIIEEQNKQIMQLNKEAE